MRTSSMDGYSSTTSADFEYGKMHLIGWRRVDPKKAKRIIANRQFAARSKVRFAITLSAHVTLLQRDASGLTNVNRELKLKLQATEQQAQLREALNEALRDELQRLKIAAVSRNNNSGLASQLSSNPPFIQLLR